MPAGERCELLHEVARRLRADAEGLARAMTAEGGKPLVENRDELEWTAAAFDYYAEIGRDHAGRVIPPIEATQLAMVVKDPLGVVGCIVPWNYPLLLLAWKVAPALAAGNCVVCKPSELTPLSTLMLAAVFEQMPAGTVNLIAGAGDVGAALAHHEDVDCIAFTGSVATGKRVAEACTPRMARMNLEMGGKDAFIVCADVAPELEVAARGGAWAAFLNAGQVCTSAERFYVAEEVFDDYVSAFVEHTRSLELGDPYEVATDIGPMVSDPQRAKVVAQLEAASAEGAEILVGGDRGGQERGHFLSPAVVVGAGPESALLREETFGPVAPIVPVASLEEAIALANSTEFGLGANVYTGELESAVRCMRELRAGTVWINDPLTDNDAGPFRRLQAVRARTGAGPRGPRGVPGDQARAHGDQDRAQGMVVPLQGVRRWELTSRIPFVDLDAARLETGGELEAAVARVVESGRFLLGPELEEFEREFAAHAECRHCVGVSSGLSAIELALRAAGVGPGDEVIVPAYTWVATWLAVTRAGADPIGVDVEETTYNIDPELIGAAITERTAAIVPVHLRGQPADVDAIDAIASAADLVVIEDAAQAHGARYRGRRVGSLGGAAAFSFYPTKNLGGIGDGGAVTTDDDRLAERVRLLRNYGMRNRYEIEESGTNSRLSEVQAAALRVKLPRLDDWNLVRAAHARAYADAFAGSPSIAVPEVPAWADPAWHLFVIGHPDRDACSASLADAGIESLVHYPLLPHRSGAYAERWPTGSFPVAERLAGAALSLPIHPRLDPTDRERVSAAVLATVGG